MSDLPYSPSQLCVMIVDDHDPIRKSIKRVLIGMGFGEVVESFDGDDALKILAKKPVDLLILDLYMRNVRGFAVLDFIRNRDMAADVPVIIVTGEASKEEIVKVADMGADDYLLKPFQAQDLEKKVVKTLGSYFSPAPLLRALRSAERLFLNQNYTEALEAFDAAHALDPLSARVVHGRARTFEKLHRIDDAIAMLRDSIQGNQSYHKNHRALADMLLQNGQTAAAIDAMRRELEINPKQPDRQVVLARLLLKESDAVGAVEHFRIALQEDAKMVAALMGMGQAYGLANNIDKALYYFKRVRRYHPGATKALEAAVRCAMAAGEPKKAELLLRDEKTSHPERSDTYILLSMFYLKQERDDDALAIVDELLAKDAESAIGHKIRASVCLKRGDHPGALAALQVVVRVAPSADVLTTMAESQLAIGKLTDALDTLNKAVSLNADSPQAMFLLAEVHRKTKQWIKAYFLYRRAAVLGADRERCQSEARECSMQLTARRQRPRAAS